MPLVLIALALLLTHLPAKSADFDETKNLAESGDAWYQTELGLMYHRGQGVKMNFDEAEKWYRLAAEQGFSKAQANLGVMYGEGHGVTRDYTEAAKWFRRAAEQGNALAQHHLGLLYGTGKGVEQNYAEAYVWESLAAASGHPAAAKNRDICMAKLDEKELKAARRRESFLYLKIEQRKRSQ